MNRRIGIVALGLSSFLFSSGATANPINFVPGGDSSAGKLKCEIPVSSLGKLILRKGSAVISDRVITIKSGSEISEAPRTVLVGSVLRTDANLTSEPPSITGLALFLMGDYEGQIDDGATSDTIFSKGKQIEGRILGIEEDSISVKLATGQQQKIPLGAILYIRSPRVFVFKIALKSKDPLQKDVAFQAESADVSFRPTAQARTLSGSVIPQSEKKEEDDGFGGMSGMGGMTSRGSGFGGMNSIGAPTSIAPPGMKSAVPDSRDNYFDAEERQRFGTVKTKWGKQQLTVPPGYLE